MTELDNQGASDSGAIAGADATPAADQDYDVIAGMQAYARSRQTSGFGARVPRNGPRFKRTLLILAALTVAIVAGGALVGYGVSQWRGAGQRQAAEQLAKQREADLQLAQQQAEQGQASEEASQQAAIPEGKLVSAHIAALKAMRAELGGTMSALTAKGKSSASDADAWDRKWAARQASYSSDYSSVSAHNARERRRYLASKVEVSKNGQLVVRYTYRPRYLGYPARPSKPAPLRASVDSEKQRLLALQSQADALISTLGPEATSAKSFASIYPVLDNTARALGAAVGEASRMVGAVVVTKGAKGKIIDTSKISSVNLTALDASLAGLDQSFAVTLTALGLSPEQVAAAAASAE